MEFLNSIITKGQVSTLMCLNKKFPSFLLSLSYLSVTYDANADATGDFLDLALQVDELRDLMIEAAYYTLVASKTLCKEIGANAYVIRFTLVA